MQSRTFSAVDVGGGPSRHSPPTSGPSPADDASAPRSRPVPGRKARNRAAKEANFVFIGGSGHCGSSLLTAMLGAHPRVYAIPIETKVFLNQPDDARRRRRLAQLARQCDKPAIDLVCEKTAEHIRAFDAIHRVYPTAKLIAIVRDPRDVVASYKRRRRRTDSAIRRWKVSAERLAAWQAAGLAVHVVYFERLVADPPAVLTEVCRFLGLSYDPVMLDYWKDARLWYEAKDTTKPETPAGLEAHRAYRNWQLHQPVMEDRVGTWRDVLTAAELDDIGRDVGKLASAHGYALPKPRPKWLWTTWRQLAGRLVNRSAPIKPRGARG